jgi:protein-S-isoprenylcysteine O-methyltransferase Ste14
METAWYFRLFFVHLVTFIISWTLYGALKAKRMGTPTGRAWMLFFWTAFIVGWVLMWFIPFKINAAFWIGLAIIVFGEVVYALGFLAMREHPEKKKVVVDWGIYKVSRHSHIMAGEICLLGTVIVGWSTSAIYGTLWIYFALYLIVSHIYVRSEDKANIKKFGKEYEDYMRRTPRYIGMPK